MIALLPGSNRGVRLRKDIEDETGTPFGHRHPLTLRGVFFIFLPMGARYRKKAAFRDLTRRI